MGGEVNIEKDVERGLTKVHIPILTSYQIDYNYVRLHGITG